MSPPINPTYPVEEVRSVEQLMAIAIGVEHEAATRYDQLAQAMEDRGEGELAATFRELAELERDHEKGLESWVRREGRAVPAPVQFSWHFPETFDWTEAEGLLPTPYQALSIAVRNEERAFSFYTYLAAMADQLPEVGEHAEALAREELNHVAQLRRLRRRAYHSGGHADRPAAGSLPRVAALPGLRHVAGQLETGSAELADMAADCLERAGQRPSATMMRKVAAQSRGRIATLELADERLAAGGSPALKAARAGGLLDPGTLTPKGVLALCERDANEVLETYLSIADHAREEDLLRTAQQLAEGAMARLAVIRSQRV